MDLEANLDVEVDFDRVVGLENEDLFFPMICAGLGGGPWSVFFVLGASEGEVEEVAGVS